MNLIPLAEYPKAPSAEYHRERAWVMATYRAESSAVFPAEAVLAPADSAGPAMGRAAPEMWGAG